LSLDPQGSFPLPHPLLQNIYWLTLTYGD
jgi:hypothetical protein